MGEHQGKHIGKEVRGKERSEAKNKKKGERTTMKSEWAQSAKKSTGVTVSTLELMSST